MQARLSLYYGDLNVNVLDVLDTGGRVLVHEESGANPQAFGGVGHTMPSVRAALAGQEVTAVDTAMPYAAAAGYALRATVPLRDGARIAGVVVVGRQLDDIFALRIGTALNATVNLIGGTQRTGTSLSAGTPPLAGAPIPRSILRRLAGGKPSIAPAVEGGQAVLSGLVPLAASEGPPAAAVEVVNPLDPLYQVITQLSLLLLIMGAGVVVAGTALALNISRRLTTRLLQLEAAAARVAAHAGQGSTHDGDFRDLRDAAVMRGHDEVASLARSFGAMMGALVDRMDANARLYADTQARVRELTGLAEIARLLTAGSSLEQTLHALGTQVCHLVGCAAVSIVLYGREGTPNVSGGAGLPDHYVDLLNATLADTTHPGGATLVELAMKSGDVAWRRVADVPDDRAALRALAQSAGWQGIVAVPLRLHDRTIGAMTCYTRADVLPPPSDLSLLTTVAGQVAVVVENARLQAQARELAAAEERQRLARDLHDSVSQALYGIALGARTARTLLDSDPARAAQPLDYVLTLADAGIVEMRALIFELRPEALDTEGLVSALEKQVAFAQARHGIAVHAMLGDEPSVPYAVKEALYRIAQEALHNTVKHARARHVEVRLASHAHGLVLEVWDDGVGFDPHAAFPGHLGLRTMRERAAQLGGTLQVESSQGHGTRICAEIPLPSPRATVRPVSHP
ncbi:MAG: hypothetical protein NVSMB65_03440 [Chloroflexota bacterium]